MTLHERQKAAVLNAVIKAIRAVGKETIQSGEFFGMKQSKPTDAEIKKAA